jgi:hypothetical protein
MILVGLMLSTAAFAATGDNAIAISRIAAPLWLTGIALTITGCWKDSPPQEHKRWDRWEIAVVIALTLASFILRAWGADHMPYVLSGDEGSAGLTAWEFLDGRRSNVLGLGWFSFPSLYFWILSLSQRVADYSCPVLGLQVAFQPACRLAQRSVVNGIPPPYLLQPRRL